MEAFLRGVPPDVTRANLREELMPYIATLEIQGWSCHKAKKKDIAWVRFATEVDCTTFLQRHGATKISVEELPDSRNAGRSHLQPRLHLFSSPIFAKPNKQPIGVQAFSAQSNADVGHDNRDRLLKSASSQFSTSITSVSCGKNLFTGPGRTLTFASHATYETQATTARFARRGIVVAVSSLARIEISYESIEEVISDGQAKLLTLVLNQVPRFYAPKEFSSSQCRQPWKRTISIAGWTDHNQYVSSCMVYQLGVNDANFGQLIQFLEKGDAVRLSQMPLAQHCPHQGTGSHLAATNQFETAMERLASKPEGLGFPVLFVAQTLLLNNYVDPEAAHRFLEVLSQYDMECRSSRDSPRLTVEAIRQVFQSIPYPVPGIDWHDVDADHIFNLMLRAESRLQSEYPHREAVYGGRRRPHQVWVFKAMVTPATVQLLGPEPENTNRVLRMFPDHNEHFLRVQFCDEDGQDLQFNTKISLEHVYNRFSQVCRQGLCVGGRQFEFLGFSHSSLRAHSAWFFAPFFHNGVLQDYQSILRSLGDFGDIRIPAKCAARIGQAFSETPFSAPIQELGIEINYIPDVKSANGSRVFSDGVGTLSRSAMEDLWRHIPATTDRPTCFQIRLGGFKGMLALDSRLPGKVIQLRKESMMKFPSADLGDLGICDFSSRPLRMVLNRQIIKILEDLGVPEEWFIRHQEASLNVLRQATATARNTASFIKLHNVGTKFGLPKFIKQLDQRGIDYRRDRFLRAAVENVVLSELRLLKHKARIPVRTGVTLFGVMDETGFLQPGEVFVAYVHEGAHFIDPMIPDGPVLVTRSPALHPGDIQKQVMVTPPEGHPLRELRNCVVFSQRGSRDTPSMLSGGDLDGDLYNVIWDVPSECMSRPSFEPADYPRATPQPLDRPVERNDITEFFVQFMKADCLALIATRHQILADTSLIGTLDPTCKSLAEIHSTAVDFSKTGIPVPLNSVPRPPRTRPDFMAQAPPLEVYDLGQIDNIGEIEEDDENDVGMNTTRPVFHRSTKILGKLYRNIDEKKIWEEDIHARFDSDEPSIWNELLRDVLSEVKAAGLDIDYNRRRADAWRLRSMHDCIIDNKRFEFAEHPRRLLSEPEVFCGFLLTKRGSQTRRQRDASAKLKDETDQHMVWMTKLIQDHRVSDEPLETPTMAGSTTLDHNPERAIELALACVSVSCVKVEHAPDTYRGSGKLKSFRVLAACCLLRELESVMSIGTKKLTRDDRIGGYVQGRGHDNGQPGRSGNEHLTEDWSM